MRPYMLVEDIEEALPKLSEQVGRSPSRRCRPR